MGFNSGFKGLRYLRHYFNRWKKKSISLGKSIV